MAEGPLRGKVAIVTGAGSPIGIGHAITLGFVHAGARVAMLDLNQAWLEQSVREAKAIGGEDCALAIVADVTDLDAVEQAVHRTIVEFGTLHLEGRRLPHNAETRRP
jgi:3-oxoacyl-[acyl-carrier protein] reductase